MAKIKLLTTRTILGKLATGIGLGLAGALIYSGYHFSNNYSDNSRLSRNAHSIETILEEHKFDLARNSLNALNERNEISTLDYERLKFDTATKEIDFKEQQKQAEIQAEMGRQRMAEEMRRREEYSKQIEEKRKQEELNKPVKAESNNKNKPVEKNTDITDLYGNILSSVINYLPSSNPNSSTYAKLIFIVDTNEGVKTFEKSWSRYDMNPNWMQSVERGKYFYLDDIIKVDVNSDSVNLDKTEYKGIKIEEKKPEISPETAKTTLAEKVTPQTPLEINNATVDFYGIISHVELKYDTEFEDYHPNSSAGKLTFKVDTKDGVKTFRKDWTRFEGQPEWIYKVREGQHFYLDDALEISANCNDISLDKLKYKEIRVGDITDENTSSENKSITQALVNTQTPLEQKVQEYELTSEQDSIKLLGHAPITGKYTNLTGRVLSSEVKTETEKYPSGLSLETKTLEFYLESNLGIKKIDISNPSKYHIDSTEKDDIVSILNIKESRAVNSEIYSHGIGIMINKSVLEEPLPAVIKTPKHLRVAVEKIETPETPKIDYGAPIENTNGTINFEGQIIDLRNIHPYGKNGYNEELLKISIDSSLGEKTLFLPIKGDMSKLIRNPNGVSVLMYGFPRYLANSDKMYLTNPNEYNHILFSLKDGLELIYN